MQNSWACARSEVSRNPNRITRPGVPRPFRTPLAPLVPALSAATSLFLIFSLPWET
jgi:hypothetical protein